MTPEQLDEIEKLAEEATPDPWCVAIRGSEVTIETTGVECFVVAEMPRSGATDVQDATFIRAMREYALPLVKALREAREALDEREGDMHARIRAGYDKTVADMWRAHCAKIEKERDEALAAKAKAEEYASQLGAWHPHSGVGMLRLIEAEKERDEARALLAALKEEHRPADELRSQLLAEIEAHAETKAEVERLRSVLRQVHALAAEAVSGTAVWSPLVEIHKITKGMVE